MKTFVDPKNCTREGFLGGSDRKEAACNAAELGLIPGLGKIPQEKGMTTHSSILAWRIPWIGERGGPPSMGSQSDTTEDCLILTSYQITLKAPTCHIKYIFSFVVTYF